MKHIYNFLKQAFREENNGEAPKIFIYLLSAVLISIPLKYAFGSITSILFILTAFVSFKKSRFNLQREILLPVAFYILMLLSVFWTRDVNLTMAGLQKEMLMLFFPAAFIFIPRLSRNAVNKVMQYYSYAMVLFALFYFGKAVFRFIETKNTAVFFYHELVTLDVNAIYVSVFASMAMFYFLSQKPKKLIDQIATSILIVLVFLLSSKSIIFIDFILVACYYSFFLDIPKSVRFLTVTSVTCFLVFSLVFVKQIRERFIIEYETAFVDNTVNEEIGKGEAKVYNISLNQAWNNEKFEPNNFFPGTAMRIYQGRIFTEMVGEDNIFFTGYGLEASQFKIREKAHEKNLYLGYGDFNFHNQYIQTFAELGFFGFLILVAMLYFNLKNALANQNFLHIVFAVTMIILFLTESFFCRQRGIIFFITLYCLFNTMRKPEAEKI